MPHPHPLRPCCAFTLIEALIAVLLVGVMMGTLFLANSNAISNMVTGSLEVDQNDKVQAVGTSVYRLADAASAIYVTPLMSTSGLTLEGIQQAAFSVGGKGYVPNTGDDPSIPCYDPRVSGTTFLNTGYMVWFVITESWSSAPNDPSVATTTEQHVYGLLTISLTSADVLTVALRIAPPIADGSLAAFQSADLLATDAQATTPFITYTQAYADGLHSTWGDYRAQAWSFPTDAATFALLHSVRQFEGSLSRTQILLPHPFDLDAPTAALRISPQGLLAVNALPMFIYAHAATTRTN